MGIINRTSKHSHVQKKKSRVKICKTLALPTSLYRNETWAMKEQNKSRMSEEMIFMGRMAKYT